MRDYTQSNNDFGDMRSYTYVHVNHTYSLYIAIRTFIAEALCLDLSIYLIDMAQYMELTGVKIL